MFHLVYEKTLLRVPLCLKCEGTNNHAQDRLVVNSRSLPASWRSPLYWLISRTIKFFSSCIIFLALGCRVPWICYDGICSRTCVWIVHVLLEFYSISTSIHLPVNMLLLILCSTYWTFCLHVLRNCSTIKTYSNVDVCLSLVDVVYSTPCPCVWRDVVYNLRGLGWKAPLLGTNHTTLKKALPIGYDNRSSRW